MPKIVNRQQVQDLMKQGAQLLDVLPGDEYEEQHIAGAISIPLKKLDAKTSKKLDRGRAVITYCWDYQ